MTAAKRKTVKSVLAHQTSPAVSRPRRNASSSSSSSAAAAAASSSSLQPLVGSGGGGAAADRTGALGGGSAAAPLPGGSFGLPPQYYYLENEDFILPPTNFRRKTRSRWSLVTVPFGFPEQSCFVKRWVRGAAAETAGAPKNEGAGSAAAAGGGKVPEVQERTEEEAEKSDEGPSAKRVKLDEAGDDE